MLSRINQTQNGPRTMGYRIEGEVDPSSYQAMAREIDKSIEKNGEVSVLIELDHPSFATPQVLWETLRRSVKRFDGLKRVAVVSDDRGYDRDEAGPGGPSVRQFPPLDERHAWRWVATGDTHMPGEDAKGPVDTRTPRPI